MKKIPQQRIKPLVDKGKAILTQPPSREISDTVVDTPLLGNGDFGVAIGGDGYNQVLYLGKNDFWTQAHLGETREQREKRLLTKEGRRSGSRIKTAGWLSIGAEELKGCDYHAVQNPYPAQVEVEYHAGEAALAGTYLVCATQNTLICQLKNTGKVPLTIRFATMPGVYNTGEIYGYEDCIREGTVCTEYPAEPYELPGRRWVYACATSDRPDTVYTPEKMSRKGGSFVLQKGESARIFLTLLSDLDCENPKEESFRLSQLAKTNWRELTAAHQAWWMDYWSRSLVESGDETLDSFYYASMYIIGSAVRAGKVPPGLFGPWVTYDRPKWTGSYTLNYNYQSPFFCLYPSNRQDLVTSYIEPLLDIIPVGKMYAQKKFGREGICLPVEIGPWGMVCSSIFHHQKTNAAYCCCNIFMHYFSTLDEEWGSRAYPFVRETADFWESDLIWEPEQNRYSVVGDSLHEEYYKDTGEKNNTHALGLVRMVMKGILDMSESLGLDAQKREKWRHILEHLAPFPVFERNGQQVFRFNEDSYPWRESNGTALKMIYPFHTIGLDSDPKLLEIARNTISQRTRLFDNGNAFCEFTAMCATVSWQPRLLLEKLKEQCELRSMPNKYIWHGGGGIEDCGGVTDGLHEMMLQSHEGVLRCFPAWPKDQDACFVNLRGYGAFLVSSSIRQGAVQQIEVESEKGHSLTIELPWEAALVETEGKSFTVQGPRVTLESVPGQSFRFTQG